MVETFSQAELPVIIATEGVEIRAREAGEMAFVFYRFKKGADLRRYLHGLPGDACTCRHWGYVLSGKLRIHTPSGATDVAAGRAFYVAPGHVPEALEDTEMVEVSPVGELRVVGEHLLRELASESGGMLDAASHRGGAVVMQNAQITKELLDLERRYWQAIKDGDASTATQLTDDSCIVAGAQGVAMFGRDAIGSMLGQATYRLNDFRLSDEVAEMVDDNVAVIAYKAHEDLEVDGAPVSLDVLESSTWVRRAGQWHCAAHTESIAGDPFGRDRKTSGQT